MKMNLLYPLLLAVVLTTLGCSREENANNAGSTESTESAGPYDETTATDAGDEGVAEQIPVFRIVFLGDSITAGLGVDEEQAFPSLIRQRVASGDYPFQVLAAGVSGETSSAGLTRIDWILRNPVDVLVLELGGNDALRGIDLAVTKANLIGIIEHTRSAYPKCKIVIAGMMVPPNLGHEYTTSFRDMYPEIAKRFNATLIPFILEGVGGVRQFMQSDGIHPNAEGHAIVTETVWRYLEPVLRSVTTSTAQR